MKPYLLYILFIACAVPILANRFTAFYISDYRLHFVLLFIAASTFVIIVGQLYNKLKSVKSIMVTVVIVGIICFLKAFITWGGDWKTEKIVFRNSDTVETIELQLRGDRFAFGYKDRVIKVRKLAPGMMWTTDVDTLYLGTQWIRVNEPVQILHY